MTDSIFERVSLIKSRILRAEHRFHRLSNSVQLIAMSKSQSAETIKKAIAAGQRIFRESYVQESLEKIKKLRAYRLEWHFVGRIQTNKAKAIAENFTWIHSLSEIKTAERLNHYRRANNSLPLNVCIQINLDKEPTKTGIQLEELIPFAQAIEKFSHLNLRGLMAIPQEKTHFTDQREIFKKLRIALENLQQLGFKLETLSMGMSDDFEAAIAEGATHVRIGVAIFGKRK